jgi:hypothetical protein
MQKTDGRHPNESRSVPPQRSRSPVSALSMVGSKARGFDEASPTRPRAEHNAAEGNRSSTEKAAKVAPGEEHLKDTSKSARSRPSTRTSSDHTSHGRVFQRPPVPPLPPSAASVPPGPQSPVALQRVFIGNKERFNMVEINSITSAQDVLNVIGGQGQLENLEGSGASIVWEIAQDFGMGQSLLRLAALSEQIRSRTSCQRL